MASAIQAVDADAAPTEWVFENVSPMGGATGEAFTNTLASPGMTPASVLAREAIQNSVDAQADGKPKVRVEFAIRMVEGEEKSAFVDAAGLDALSERANLLGFRAPNCAATLDDATVPLKLLFIDDYETTGLEGDPADSDSKFARFLLSLGDGGKEHSDHGSGGSYGFGKSVYSSNSGILSIFAYSRTVDGDGNPLSLLFGCGYFRKHKFEGDGFTGRAWFGIDETPSVANAQQIVVPLVGAAAEAKAAALGFELRDDGDLGTSVMIVDAMIESDDLLAGIEDWWWPRLVSNLLDVRVIEADGTSRMPRPRKREDLRPFLEAFDLANGKSPANGKTDFQKVFNKFDGMQVGAVGFKVLRRDDDDKFVVPDERLDAVALIRSPLMVVAYHRQWTLGTPTMVGAYMAATDIDNILRAAEPPAHDRWDRDARRLQDESGRRRNTVDSVLTRIRQAIKQSQSTASPPPPPRPKRLSLLERTLASFLSPSKPGTKTTTGPTPTPISLTYVVEPRAETADGALRLQASFQVKLKTDEDSEKLRARVRVTCPVIEDGQVGDPVGVTMKADTKLTDDPDRPGWQIFDLKKSKGVRFDCTTDKYDQLWTVRFVPEVEPVEAE